MKSINWKYIVEFVGIAAIVASLVFVGAQIQLEGRAASAQVNMAALEARLSVEAVIAENADVLTKARNKEELSDSEMLILVSIVNMASSKAFFESMSGGIVRGRNYSDVFTESSGAVAGFSIWLHENPSLRKIWAERADRRDVTWDTVSENDGPIRFNNLVRAHLAKLDQ